MKTSVKHVAALLVFSISGALVACSSSSSSSNGASGCTPADGTYAVTTTLKAGSSASCPAGSRSTTTYPAPDAGVTSEGDAGADCTQSCNGNAFQETCTVSAGSFTITTTTNATYTSTGGSGTVTETESGLDGGAGQTCSYTVVATRQ